MPLQSYTPPSEGVASQIDVLAKTYRQAAEAYLTPLVLSYYPALIEQGGNEYRKMVELSAKMTLVGRACTEIAGYPFDARRRMVSILYGGCCFLGDSFIDEFGQETAEAYLERFHLLLTEGWFDVRNDREQLFYVVISRLFAERDVLDPVLRQAILWLFLAQQQDVGLREKMADAPKPLARRQLGLLRNCTRDRGGHAITTLTLFLVPEIPLAHGSAIFHAGSLIGFIDDHGDCHADRRRRCITYMNQLQQPRRALIRMFGNYVRQIQRELPWSAGRDLLEAFLYRYFVTRMAKHKLERGSSAVWAVYE